MSHSPSESSSRTTEYTHQTARQDPSKLDTEDRDRQSLFSPTWHSTVSLSGMSLWLSGLTVSTAGRLAPHAAAWPHSAVLARCRRLKRPIWR